MYKNEVTIYVTEEHIKEGSRFEPKFCPIARACRSMGWDVDVSSGYISVIDGEDSGNVAALYKLPANAINFIWMFDLMLDVIPFSFTAFRVQPQSVD